MLMNLLLGMTVFDETLIKTIVDSDLGKDWSARKAGSYAV